MMSTSGPFQEKSGQRRDEKPCQLRRRNVLMMTSVLTLLIVGCSLCAVMTDVVDSDDSYVTFSADGISYGITNEGAREAWVVGSDQLTVSIPATVDYNSKTYTVVAICPRAFEGKPLTSVSASESMRTVFAVAFHGCTSLKSVDLPGVSRIESQAFDGCTGLQELKIPEIVLIGENAFRECTGLTSLTLPSSVKSIGTGAFYNCTEMTSLTIHGSETTIGSSAFCGCAKLKTFDLQGITSIGYRSFNYTGIQSIDISGVKSIGSYAFERCYSLSYVTIHGSDASLSSGAFNYCVNLKSADLQGVTSIGMSAFYNCRSLQSVDMPDVKSIDSNAFVDCGSLTSVTIPDSVTLGMQTFNFCTSLQYISFGKNISAKFATIWPISMTDVFDVKCFVDENGNTLNPSDMSQFEGQTFTGNADKMVRGASSTVTFSDDLTVKNGGNAITSGDTVDCGTELTVEAKEKEGYVSKVFLNGKELTRENFKVGLVNVLTVTYTETFEVTFSDGLTVKNGGNVIASGTKVVCGTELTVEAEEKEGHTSKILLNEAWLGGRTTFTVNEGSRLAVEYTPNQYEVTFSDGLTVESSNGEILSGAYADYGIELTVKAADEIGKKAKVLLNGTELTGGSFKVGLVNVLTVTYEDAFYMVTFDENLIVKNNGTAIESGGKVAKDTELTVKAAVREGYTPEIRLNGTGLSATTFTVTEDSGLAVNYTPNYYKVTFNDGLTVKNGTTKISSGTEVAYDTKLTVEATEIEGHTLKIRLNGTELVGGSFKVGLVNDLTATYDDIYCTVTFNEGLTVKNGGTAISSGDSVIYGTNLTVKITEKEGHEPIIIFFTNTKLKIMTEETFTATQDSELFLIYVPQFEVTFDDGLIVKNDGTEIVSGTKVTFGRDLTVEAKEKEGYTSKIYLNGKELETREFTVDEVNKLSVIYTPKVYAVNITVQGEGSVDSAELKIPYGTAASVKGNVLTIGENTITATPSDKDHTFTNWSGVPETVTSDVRITACFTQIFIDDKAVIKTDTADIVAEKTGGTTSITTEIKADAATNVDEAIAETLDKIAEVKAASGSSDENVSVQMIVPVNTVSGRLTMSAATATALKDSGAGLTVTNGDAAVSLDADAIGTLKEAAVASGDKLSIEVTPDPIGLSSSQKKVIGENKAVDVSAFLGEEKVSNLGGKATISIPYVTDKKVKVTYVMDNGKTEDIECTYADGVVSFVTTHFSVYMISEISETVPVTPVVPDTDDDYYPIVPTAPTETSQSNDNGDVKTIVACAAAAVAAALAAAFFIIDSRRS